MVILLASVGLTVVQNVCITIIIMEEKFMSPSWREVGKKKGKDGSDVNEGYTCVKFLKNIKILKL